VRQREAPRARIAAFGPHNSPGMSQTADPRPEFSTLDHGARLARTVVGGLIRRSLRATGFRGKVSCTSLLNPPSTAITPLSITGAVAKLIPLREKLCSGIRKKRITTNMSGRAENCALSDLRVFPQATPMSIRYYGCRAYTRDWSVGQILLVTAGSYPWTEKPAGANSI
jgi:hypothetical protein